MKIAIIINLFPPKWLAGTEIATYSLAKHLVRRGHEIHVITSHDDGLPNFDKENGFYIHRIAWPKIRIIGVLLFWLQIFLKIRTIKPDIVQAQDLSMGIPAVLVKLIIKKPFIIWGRGDDVYRPGTFIRMTTGFILQKADGIIALTTDMQKKLKQFTPRKISIIPNGIELDGIINNIPIKNESINQKIIYVGRLEPVKGVEYLIMAMKLIHNEMPSVQLVLVGDGNERDRLETLSSELDIYKSVEFVGKIPHEDVQAYLQDADVFVLPSLSEGFPNVLLEAMACGLPIVATRIGGIPDIIEDGIHGYLVESKNFYELATKIMDILQDVEFSKKISSANKEEARAYSYENIICNLEGIFREAININN